MDDTKKVEFNQTKCEKQTGRNTCLFFFEALACLLIIFIHCNFPGNFGIIMNGTARFGVPLFFTISGFFLYKDGASDFEIRQKLKKRIVRISILLAFSFSIYFTIGILTSCFGTNATGIVAYLKNTFSWKNIILLLLCNNPLINVINWFMIALLFSYFIIFLFPSIFTKNQIFILIISSLSVFWIIFRIVIMATHLEINGFSLSSEYLYRSWYAHGLMFICLGILFKKNESFLKTIPMVVALITLFVTFSIMIIEHFVLTNLFGQGTSYYFGSLGCVFAIFTISVKKPLLFVKSKILNMKGNWTMFVYIFHTGVIAGVSIVISKLNVQSALIDWFKPLFVLVISFIIAVVFNLFVEVIKPSINK